MDRRRQFASRTAIRGGAVGVFLALLTSGGLFSGALADTPSGWDKVEPVSALSFLMLVLVWPLAIALVLALLTYLPSLARRGSGN